MARRARGSLVHPVDAVAVLRPALARVFMEALDFLDLALFVSFAAELVDAFALFEGFLFFGPHAFLVAEEGGVP